MNKEKELGRVLKELKEIQKQTVTCLKRVNTLHDSLVNPELGRIERRLDVMRIFLEEALYEMPNVQSIIDEFETIYKAMVRARTIKEIRCKKCNSHVATVTKGKVKLLAPGIFSLAGEDEDELRCSKCGHALREVQKDPVIFKKVVKEYKKLLKRKVP